MKVETLFCFLNLLHKFLSECAIQEGLRASTGNAKV